MNDGGLEDSFRGRDEFMNLYVVFLCDAGLRRIPMTHGLLRQLLQSF